MDSTPLFRWTPPKHRVHSHQRIALAAIEPNPEQPRTDFSGDALEELAASIRTLGINPAAVAAENRTRPLSDNRRREAFPRRRHGGLDTVPAYIRSANETELTEMALIENIQREDLNAIEIALTFRKLIDRYNLTQERLSERIGKNRATVANFLRLLRLPAKCSSACATNASTWAMPEHCSASPTPRCSWNCTNAS